MIKKDCRPHSDLAREWEKLHRSYDRILCDDYTCEWDKAHGIPSYIINENHAMTRQRMEKAEAKYDHQRA